MYLLGPLKSRPIWSIIQPMKQTDPQFKLRIPPELKQLIEDAAKANNRSMSAEIAMRLEHSFSSDKQWARGGYPKDHERLKYLELVYDAFQSTSEDFTLELGKRLSSFMQAKGIKDIDEVALAEKLRVLLKYRSLV